MMEIGIDSFAAASIGTGDERAKNSVDALAHLLERIERADQVGLDVFGIGEHHRKEFLDSAPAIILAAAAARTKRIKLTSAVTVLSAAYPLFGLDLNDYNELFTEKLDLLLNIRSNEFVTWSGKFRAALNHQAVYPRPFQPQLPIWLGVGGTPESFVRAGTLGLPLMVAVIGGETHRFRPLIDLYRKAGEKAGHAPEKLKVGLHSLGYVAHTSEDAAEQFYPGYAKIFTRIGKERGWPAVTRNQFEAQNGPRGAFLVGNPEEIAEKILRHSEALGGISRVTFQMDNAELSHEQLLQAIELIGTRVAPLVNKKIQNV